MFENMNISNAEKKDLLGRLVVAKMKGTLRKVEGEQVLSDGAKYTKDKNGSLVRVNKIGWR